MIIFFFFCFFRIGNDSFTFLLYRNFLLLFNGQIRWISFFSQNLCSCVVVWSKQFSLNFVWNLSRFTVLMFLLYFPGFILCTRWMDQVSWNSNVRLNDINAYMRNVIFYEWYTPAWPKLNQVEWFSNGLRSISIFWMVITWLLSAAVPIYKFMVKANYSLLA